MLTVLSILALILIAMFGVSLLPKAGSAGLPSGSSQRLQDDGTSVLREYAQKRWHPVESLLLPLSSQSVPLPAVVLRFYCDPQQTLSPDEDRFVRDGGNLVLAGNDWDLDTMSVKACLPPAAGIRTLAFGAARTDLSGTTVLASATASVLTLECRGRGRILRLAGSAMLDNRHLPLHDNAVLAEMLLCAAGSESPKMPCWFDEAHLEQGKKLGLIALIELFGLGPLLVILLCITLLVWWRRSGGLGPPELLPSLRRTLAGDGVDSLAALYGRLLPLNQLLEMRRMHLHAEFARRTQLSGDALTQAFHTFAPDLPAPGTILAANQHNITLLDDAFRRLDHVHATQRA